MGGMSGAASRNLRALALNDQPVEFYSARIDLREGGICKTWSVSVFGVSSSLAGWIGRPCDVGGVTIDGRLIDGRGVMESVSILTGYVRINGTGPLVLDGELQ